jgi:porin
MDSLVPAPADVPTEGPHGRFAANEGWWHTRLHQTLITNGVHPYLSYALETMGNLRGGLNRGGVVDGLLEAGFRLDLDRLVGWKGGHFCASMAWTHGPSLSQKYIGDIFNPSNLDAEDSVRLYELWLEQRFFDDRLVFKAGNLAADREFLTSNLSSLFCNATFGWPGIAGSNIRAPAFPLTTPGFKLIATPHERLSFSAAVFNGEPDPLDAQGQSRNQHGVHFDFSHHPLTMFELAFQPTPNPATTIKLGGWYHFGDYDDYRYDTSGMSLADPLSSGIPRIHSGNFGLYVMLDLALWRERQEDGSSPNPLPSDGRRKEAGGGLSLFGRVAAVPGDRNLVSFYADGGLHYRGLLTGRDDDEIGLGLAYGRISPHARGTVADDNFYSAGTAAIPDYEMVLEFTYKAYLKQWWTIQPDLQWIIHPGGSSALKNALVIGLRSTVSF